MDRAARLRKRGSLQARERHTISKASGERLYSVPNFLELAGGGDVIHHQHQSTFAPRNRIGVQNFRYLTYEQKKKTTTKTQYLKQITDE